MTLKFVTALLSTTMFLTAAQAAEKKQPDSFVEQLVKAALPKDASVAGMVNSGSFGVSLFLLCEASKNADRNRPNNGKCLK